MQKWKGTVKTVKTQKRNEMETINTVSFVAYNDVDWNKTNKMKNIIYLCSGSVLDSVILSLRYYYNFLLILLIRFFYILF